jgi:hypothetical protein
MGFLFGIYDFFLGLQYFRVFVLLLLLLLIKDLAMEQTIPLSLQVKVISAKHVIQGGSRAKGNPKDVNQDQQKRLKLPPLLLEKTLGVKLWFFFE